MGLALMAFLILIVVWVVVGGLVWSSLVARRRRRRRNCRRGKHAYGRWREFATRDAAAMYRVCKVCGHTHMRRIG